MPIALAAPEDDAIEVIDELKTVIQKEINFAQQHSNAIYNAFESFYTGQEGALRNAIYAERDQVLRVILFMQYESFLSKGIDTTPCFANSPMDYNSELYEIVDVIMLEFTNASNQCK